MPSIVTGVLSFLLSVFQYNAATHTTGPALNALYVNCYYGAEIVGNVICFVLLLLYDLEKFMPARREEILLRRKKDSESC